MVVTAKGEVRTKRGSTSVRSRSWPLRDWCNYSMLDETPAVLSLGKLFEDHGYSHDWVSGQKPRLTPNGKTITCRVDKHVHLVVPVLSANPGDQFSHRSVRRAQDGRSFRRRVKALHKNPYNQLKIRNA